MRLEFSAHALCNSCTNSPGAKLGVHASDLRPAASLHKRRRRHPPEASVPLIEGCRLLHITVTWTTMPSCTSNGKAWASQSRPWPPPALPPPMRCSEACALFRAAPAHHKRVHKNNASRSPSLAKAPHTAPGANDSAVGCVTEKNCTPRVGLEAGCDTCTACGRKFLAHHKRARARARRRTARWRPRTRKARGTPTTQPLHAAGHSPAPTPQASELTRQRRPPPPPPGRGPPGSQARGCNPPRRARPRRGPSASPPR